MLFVKILYCVTFIVIPESSVSTQDSSSVRFPIEGMTHPQRCFRVYVGALISLWPFLFPVFLFAAHPKEFFLTGLKKLERTHKCVWSSGGNK
jgi:hypothetical protein